MANGKPGPPLGSQNARKETRIVRDTLRKVAAQNPTKLRAACEALLDKAVDGDVGAFGVFRDTLDGKPNQSISGPDEGAIAIIAVTRPQLSREEWLESHAVGTTTRPTE